MCSTANLPRGETQEGLYLARCLRALGRVVGLCKQSETPTKDNITAIEAEATGALQDVLGEGWERR